jgi:hypothetical protein
MKFMSGAGIFFLSKVAKPFLAHLVSYSVCTGGFYPGVKWRGHEVDHASSSSAAMSKMRPF